MSEACTCIGFPYTASLSCAVHRDYALHIEEWSDRLQKAEASRDRYHKALEQIAALNMPYRSFTSAARNIARKALA